MFSWNNVDEGAWEDPDFLKPFEEQGETVEVQDGGAQTLQLKLMPAKDNATKPE